MARPAVAKTLPEKDVSSFLFLCMFTPTRSCTVLHNGRPVLRTDSARRLQNLFVLSHARSATWITFRSTRMALRGQRLATQCGAVWRRMSSTTLSTITAARRGHSLPAPERTVRPSSLGIGRVDSAILSGAVVSEAGGGVVCSLLALLLGSCVRVARVVGA